MSIFYWFCFWNSPNFESHVPVFIPPSNRVANLYTGGGGHFTTDSQSVSQSVCLGVEHPCGTCEQIFLPVEMLLFGICGLVSVGRPLWRKDGSAIYSVITQWPESGRAHNHTLLSHPRLPKPGGPGSLTYICKVQDGPVIPRGTGLFIHSINRLAFVAET
jgi:hypothetical protein